MDKKLVLCTFILVFSVLIVGQLVCMAEANFLFPPNSLPSISIRSDGSINPSTASISRSGDVYTLTSNITGYTLSVERDNTVVDGAGYTVSSDNRSSPAIYMMMRNNVTIRNMRIAWFCSAHILMGGCTNCTITGNTIVTVAGGAITLNGCNYCSLTNNTIYNGDTNYGDLKNEAVYCSDDYNTISGNHFFGGEIDVSLNGKGNTVVNNVFTDINGYAVFDQNSQQSTVENNTINGQTQHTPQTSPTQSPIASNSPAPTSAFSESPSGSPSNSQQPTPTESAEQPQTPSSTGDIITDIIIAVAAVIIVSVLLLIYRLYHRDQTQKSS